MEINKLNQLNDRKDFELSLKNFQRQSLSNTLKIDSHEQ